MPIAECGCCWLNTVVMKIFEIALAVAFLAFGTSADDQPLFGPEPIRLTEKVEIPIPAEAATPDRGSGRIALFMTVQNDRGCDWTLHTSQPPFLTDGTARFPLCEPPSGPHFGALPAGQPLALTFAVPDTRPRPLTLVLPLGVYSYSAPVGEFRLEVWKGLRFRPKAAVDAMNRMFTVDASSVSNIARAFRYALPGRAPVETRAPFWRGRLDAREPFDVQVTALLTNGETLAGAARGGAGAAGGAVSAYRTSAAASGATGLKAAAAGATRRRFHGPEAERGAAPGP